MPSRDTEIPAALHTLRQTIARPKLPHRQPCAYTGGKERDLRYLFADKAMTSAPIRLMGFSLGTGDIMNSEQQPAVKEKKLADKQTAAQKYKALLEEANKHKETAVNELRAAIQDQIVELNELGFNYRLVEGSESPKAKGEKKTRAKSDKPCPICQFKTEPYHDARNKAHRDQTEKKPLTDKQLKDAGLVKVQ